MRSEEEYFDEIQDVKITKDMLDLAKHIVNQKAGRFEPDNSKTVTKPLSSISSTRSVPASRSRRRSGRGVRMSSI